jgi:hypothetical protein
LSRETMRSARAWRSAASRTAVSDVGSVATTLPIDEKKSTACGASSRASLPATARRRDRARGSSLCSGGARSSPGGASGTGMRSGSDDGRPSGSNDGGPSASATASGFSIGPLLSFTEAMLDDLSQAGSPSRYDHRCQWPRKW